MFINSTFCNLKNKISILKKEGWFVVRRRGFGEVGLLVEEKLDLCKNDFSIPDFEGIELKVKKYSSLYPLTMFSCTCDGPSFFELKSIVEKFGIKSKNNLKVLFITLSTIKYSDWGRYLKMKLVVDRIEKKVYILIANTNGKIIEKKSYWTFSTLNTIMQRKMKYLCLIYYDTFYSCGYKYAKIINEYYLQFNDFNKFINELESGNIVVNIKVGINQQGKSHDHGTSFQIFKDSLFDLFDEYFF